MDDDTPTVTATSDEVREVLISAAIIISTFRRLVAQTGYPFREPPDVGKTLARIEACSSELPKRGRPFGSKSTAKAS